MLEENSIKINPIDNSNSKLETNDTSKTTQNDPNNNNENIYVELTDNVIDMPLYMSKLKDPGAGASSIFIGMTRDNFEDKSVCFLDYECHHTMAIKELKRIANKAITDYQVSKVLIVHRLGRVNVTEASILIITLSAHRGEAIKSTSWIIEEVKKSVPIWKKEHYTENNDDTTHHHHHHNHIVNEIGQISTDENKNSSFQWKENSTSVHKDFLRNNIN